MVSHGTGELVTAAVICRVSEYFKRQGGEREREREMKEGALR
jgi:hypothetical protein